MRMKNLFLTLLLVSFNSIAGTIIISDLDDTIKITHVASAASATYNGIFKKKVFTGMPEFLNEARSYTEELHILTASPGLIKKSVLRTLNSNDIQFDSVAFKNPLKREGKIEYKVRKISEILSQSENSVILLGDDVDKDPEIFQEVTKLYPTRVLAVYVHVVRGREIPAGSTIYWTAGDLALRELSAGRMSAESASRVLETIINEENLNSVIPNFADCPKEASIWEWQIQTVLAEKAAILINNLVSHCSPSPKS